MRFTDCIDITGESCKTFDGNKKYISTGAVDVDHIVQSQIELVSYDSKPSRANLMTDDKSILFAKMQGTKKILLINEDLKENVYSTGFFSVAPKNNILNKECLYHLLGSKAFLNQKDKYCSGATQKAITLDGLNKIEINIPKLEEQNQIAKRLDVIKRILDSNDLALKKYDDLIKARFTELFGTVKDNPYHFPTATLKEVCHKITDGKHGGCEQEADSGYYYVGAREIYDGVIHYDTAPQITYADFAKDYRRCNIEQGDMVIVNTGATIGKSAIASSPLTERTLLQKSVALIKVKTDVISAKFLRFCYMANPSMYLVESASAQPNLLLSKMNATAIYLPPIELQEQFVAFVEQTDKSKLAVQQSLEKTQLLFDSLMQEYFGEN